MKTKVHLMLAIMIVAVTFSECKKYDEGPRISFRSKEKRVAGEWDVTSFTINGENQLHYTYDYHYTCNSGTQIYANEEYTTTRFIWTFDNEDWNFSQTESDKQLDQQSTYTSCYAMYDYTTDTYTDNGTWKFISDKEKIELVFDANDVITMNIKELKEKEMKLEGADSSGEIWKFTFSKR